MAALLSGLEKDKDAASALEISENLPDKRWVPPQVGTSIAKHLRDQLLSIKEDDFREVFYQAVRWIKPDGDPVVAMVLALARQKRSKSRFYSRWTPPAWPRRLYRAALGSRDAQLVAERYVRQVMPYYDDLIIGDRAAWIHSLGWNLSEAYSGAMETALEQSSHGLREVVRGLFLAEPSRFDALVEMLSARLDDLHKEFGEQEEKEVREDAEPPGDDGAPDIHDYYADRAYPFSSSLRVLVEERRKQEGYEWILKHSRRNYLLDEWGDLLRQKRATAAPAEIRAFYESYPADRKSMAYLTVEMTRCLELVPDLIDSLVSDQSEGLDTNIGALLHLLTPAQLDEKLRKRAAGLTELRRAEIVLSARSWEKNNEDAFRAFSKALFPDRERLIEVLLEVLAGNDDPSALGLLLPQDLETLRSWAASPNSEPGRASLVALAATKQPILELAKGALGSTNGETRLTAVRALAFVPIGEARGLLRRALSDPFWKCRVKAVEVLAADATHEEREAIRAILRSDPSAHVLLACARAVRIGRWPEFLQELCQLLTDRHDWAPVQADEPDYRVASQAAEALKELSPLPEKVVRKLLEFVEGGTESSSDVAVYTPVLDILVRLPIPDLPARLIKTLDLLGSARPWDTVAARLRASVALKLFLHLEAHPRAQVESLNELIEIARRPEPLLAGSAVLVLGTLGARAWGSSSPIFEDGEDHREVKAFLMLAPGALRKLKVLESLPARALPTAHPARQMLEWLAAPHPLRRDKWRERWKTHSGMRRWLLTLKKGDGWESFMWGAICHFLGAPFEKSLPSRPAGPAPGRG